MISVRRALAQHEPSAAILLSVHAPISCYQFRFELGRDVRAELAPAGLRTSSVISFPTGGKMGKNPVDNILGSSVALEGQGGAELWLPYGTARRI